MMGRVACVTCVTLYPFSGISHEKFVQKKDPGNDSQCDTSDTKFFPARDLIHRTISGIFFRQKRNISNLHDTRENYFATTTMDTLNVFHHKGDAPFKSCKKPGTIHAECYIGGKPNFIKPALFKCPLGCRAGTIGNDLPEPAFAGMIDNPADHGLGNSVSPKLPVNTDLEDMQHRSGAYLFPVKMPVLQFIDHRDSLPEMGKECYHYFPFIFRIVSQIKTENEPENLFGSFVPCNKTEIFSDK